MFSGSTGQILISKFTKANSDGLLNCLCQPGLFRYRPQKSMREKFNRLIKSCGTLTVPAAETKSMGLAADPAFVEGRRAGALFFARHQDCFIVTRNYSAIYRDLVPSNSFTVTLGFSVTYRDWQKTMHRDADGNSLNRRAVMFKRRPITRMNPKQIRQTRKISYI